MGCIIPLKWCQNVLDDTVYCIWQKDKKQQQQKQVVSEKQFQIYFIYRWKLA